MSTKVNRELFLQQLESVAPGLSTREIIEQSSCYVFTDGKVITYNDEIACSQACDIGLTGAVRSQAMLSILRKLIEDELEISEEEGEIIIEGTSKKMGITREKDIALPYSSVEAPAKWKEMDEHFIEAIKLVQHCASTDESQFVLTCIHITPKWIEACDNAQMMRVKIDTGVASPILVRRDSIKHVATLGMTKFCETETWIHFKNPAGLTLSCRRFVDNYHDLTALLAMKDGKPITIPKGLADAADKAAIFAAESADEPQVKVELRPGKLRIKGKGISGWYRETKALKYNGPELAFMIAPALLIDITKKYNDAEITEGRLKVADSRWIYVSCLSPVEDK